ncbi:helix-turn-helix transcriptional regulator [Phenylobacterium sp.]|uniref:helix-turn-helix transcriptional regulator n=1 Tax=Phenylobacterium sp. TaxID=1871053 RepID=UPI0027341EDA|nr:helix-turn-helix transcriptional regulator [Phenylobacterium sp.]MDP3661008.1 helix-turn-helix transcriptional regulator [Phenylobacterium sp.]
MASNPDFGAGPSAYLEGLGERVRGARLLAGLSRKALAQRSDVSERYLAQLEHGQGNISILLLRQLAGALQTPVERLVSDRAEPVDALSSTLDLLRSLGPEQLDQARQSLLRQFGRADPQARRARIALVGLRGAGKSSLGASLAQRRGVAFIELDREIERESGLSLSAIFDLYGPEGFRRLERASLDRVLERDTQAVIATGGGIVSEPATFERLLSTCFTVWIKASPREHMDRVLAQGDTRPMSNTPEAMADLEAILRRREGLYARADAMVDTAGRTQEASLEDLNMAVEVA